MKKIAIIGSGPAGIFLSKFLKDEKCLVDLFEQNDHLGEKLKLTGGGRMNVTNKIFSETEFSSNNPRVLSKIFKNNHTKNPERLFEELNIEYFWEKQRAILKSQNALAEVEGFEAELEKVKNIKLRLKTKVLNIEVQENEKFKIIFNKNDQKFAEIFDVLVLATGGMYRIKELGKKSDIYNLVEDLGHTITAEISPMLTPLLFKNEKLRALSGISFEGELINTRTQKSIKDSILITHAGLSGPAVLDFTAIRELNDPISLNFAPEISSKKWQELLEMNRKGSIKIIKLLKNILPYRLASFIASESAIDIDKNIAELNKQELKRLQEVLFTYPIPIPRQASYPASWTTRGGIELKKIKPNSLESRIHKNCYFGGELLDVNGLCGGYNISFAAISAKIISEDILK